MPAYQRIGDCAGMDGFGGARMGERQGEPLMVNFELFRCVMVYASNTLLSQVLVDSWALLPRSGVLMALTSSSKTISGRVPREWLSLLRSVQSQ